MHENLVRLVFRELDRGRQLDVVDAWQLLRGPGVELRDDVVKLMGPALLDQEEQKVPDELVGLGEDRAQRIHLLA